MRGAQFTPPAFYPRRHGLLLIACGVFLVLVFSCMPSFARGLPIHEGILNYGKVSEHLYRGAQPDADGLKSLKRLGVKMIVNLRMIDDGWQEEAAQAQANGLLYTNFPMSGFRRPSEEQVHQILALFESFPGAIFIHCQHGCDRTGTIVACYRIQHDHWSSDLALREAKKYGISRVEYFMKRFVVNFGRPAKPDLRQAKAY
ncbi:MAG TPA: dual specificity protein phosphatase family protein [Patescibacteria group bacterium]|nr:dual specificity protein phosphatase family protein [Patescibacteria group bacterium]